MEYITEFPNIVYILNIHIVVKLTSKIIIIILDSEPGVARVTVHVPGVACVCKLMHELNFE